MSSRQDESTQCVSTLPLGKMSLRRSAPRTIRLARAVLPLAVLSAVSPLFAARPDRDAPPPNVLLIVVDDVGYGELDDSGPNPDRVPTPNIDRIAARGIRFTSAYVTASYCSPSRAGLLTGRYQQRFGCEFNPVGAENDEPGVGLPPEERTIAEHLRDAGYATALIGKWHLGGTSPFDPLRQGFDHFYGFRHEGHFYAPPPYEGMVTWLRRRALPHGSEGLWRSADGRLFLTDHMGHNEPAYDANNPILRDGQPEGFDDYLTDRFSQEAARFIERSDPDRPFFLYLSYNAIHSPMQAPVEEVARFEAIADPQRRIFAAMLARLDAGIGRVLDTLEAQGLTNQTLIVFLSDHGGPTRELTSSNAPFRGGKGTLYEGGVRVPFFLSWPGTLPAGVEDERPISALDILPTVAEIAGTPLPDDTSLDGVSLVTSLVGDRRAEPPDRTLYWKMGRRAALRSGDWKLVGDLQGDESRSAWELYRLDTDPAENRDVASTHPAKLEQLTERWRRWRTTLDRPAHEAAQTPE